MKTRSLALAALLVAAFIIPIQADELRDSLFATAKAALKSANNELADVLAPVSYEKGASLYASASNRYERSQKVSKIESELAQATQYFHEATKTAKRAQSIFKTSIQARTDAKGVEAEKLANEQWRKAERKFLSATKTLETGSLKSAKEKAEEAETLYRDAELVAIKGQYLNQTRAKIDEAEDLKVKRYAPETLAKATKLLAEAEKELSENRYDTDYPRALVKEAYYEARHSIYLAQMIRAMDKNDITPENLILEMEKPVAAIAAQLDMRAEFDQGFEPVGKQIAGKVDSLLQESHDLAELQKKHESLGQLYAQLETKMGIQSERLQQEEQARERMQKVSSLFSREQAVVLSQDDNVLIRMVGLNFNPGSSQITSENYGLLQKLEQAIRMYPEYTVVVEGHTDSFGSTQANQTLSINRAMAVRQYLMANMGDLSPTRCEAYGYGESRPIANNETYEGRKRNRRIDLLFKAPSR